MSCFLCIVHELKCRERRFREGNRDLNIKNNGAIQMN